MKHFLFTLFLLLNGSWTFAQSRSLSGPSLSDDSTHVVNHFIYLEIGGAGGYGSVNYEHLVFKKNELMLAARIGISTYHIKDFRTKFNPDILIPLTAKILYGKTHKAEIGIGETFASTIHANETDFKPKRMLNFHTHFSFGYRYQPAAGGIVIGVAYTPILEFNKSIRHWASVTLGYSF